MATLPNSTNADSFEIGAMSGMLAYIALAKSIENELNEMGDPIPH